VLDAQYEGAAGAIDALERELPRREVLVRTVGAPVDAPELRGEIGYGPDVRVHRARLLVLVTPALAAALAALAALAAALPALAATLAPALAAAAVLVAVVPVVGV
jgi:hypothetical protein